MNESCTRDCVISPAHYTSPLQPRPAVKAPSGRWRSALGTILILVASLLCSPTSWAADGASMKPSEGREGNEQGSPLLMLGVGDAVSVQVYGNEKLSTTGYIADDGSIQVPLAGKVAVEGLSPSKAADRIAAAFRDGELLVDPQVTVFLVESRSQEVSVLGAVQSPGRFTIQSNSTVLDVLAQAGGIAEEGGYLVVVLRTAEDGSTTRHEINLQGLGEPGHPVPTLLLRSGDSLFVPEAQRFSIYGEVNSPDSYRLEPGMTVVEAITRGGGVTPRGSRNRIELRRAQGGGSFSTRSASLDDEVQPDDVIRVKGRLF